MAINGIYNSGWDYEPYRLAAGRRTMGSDFSCNYYSNKRYNFYDVNSYNNFSYENFLFVPSFSFRQSYSNYRYIGDYDRYSYRNYSYGYTPNYYSYSRPSYYDSFSSKYDRYLPMNARASGNTYYSPHYSSYSATAYNTSSRARNSQQQYTTVGTAPAVNQAVRLAWQEYNNRVREITENYSPRIVEYRNGNRAPNQWCGAFVSWLYGRGQGVTNKCTFGFSESSQAIAERANRAGHFAHVNSGYRPQVGDLMIIRNHDNPSHGHVGIIVEVHSNGTFVTIEGNYDDHVEKVNRSMGSEDLYGFVKMNEWLQNS